MLTEWEFSFLENVLSCTEHSQWEEIQNDPWKVTPQVNCPCCSTAASAECDGGWINCWPSNHIVFFSIGKFCTLSDMTNTILLGGDFFFFGGSRPAHTTRRKSSEFLIPRTELPISWDQAPSSFQLQDHIQWHWSVVWAQLTNQSGEVLFVVYDAKQHSHLSQYKFFLTVCLARIFFQLCKMFKVSSSWTSFWFCIVNVISWRRLVNLRGNFSFPWCTSFYMPRNTLLFNLKMQHALSWDFSLSAVWIQWDMGRVMFPALYHSL